MCCFFLQLSWLAARNGHPLPWPHHQPRFPWSPTTAEFPNWPRSTAIPAPLPMQQLVCASTPMSSSNGPLVCWPPVESPAMPPLPTAAQPMLILPPRPTSDQPSMQVSTSRSVVVIGLDEMVRMDANGSQTRCRIRRSRSFTLSRSPPKHHRFSRSRSSSPSAHIFNVEIRDQRDRLRNRSRSPPRPLWFPRPRNPDSNSTDQGPQRRRSSSTDQAPQVQHHMCYGCDVLILHEQSMSLP